MTTYVPILTTDPSRLEGLAATPDVVKDRLTPLLDVTAPPRGRHLAPHLDALVSAIAAGFGARVAYVDACDAGNERGDDCARTADGRIHLAYLLDEARACALAFVPVTGLRRPTAYQLAVADAVSCDRRGVALRLQRPDFRDPGSLATRVLATLDALGTTPEDADLVLDFGGVTAGHVAAYESSARAGLAALTREIGWRSVTIAAATQLLADGRGARRGPRAVPRTDWLLWRALTSGASADAALDRYAQVGALRFGDYGPLLYGPHPVRPGGATEWVGYAHGAEWLVRDVVAEGGRPDGSARSESLRPDTHVVTRADTSWAGVRRHSMRVIREATVARADIVDAPADAPAWPEPHAGTGCTDANHAAVDRRGSVAERATWRAAAVAHHLMIAVEQLAPSPRAADGR